MLVNHKRVLRIIREDNLLAVQPRAFVVTADSDHEFEVYLNLASRMKLTGMNQLWVADITYIRLKKIENAKSLNCKCANSKLSQQRGSPQRCVPICALLFPTRSYHCHRTAERLKGEADSEVKERTRVPNE
jgi:hypothetical protein